MIVLAQAAAFVVSVLLVLWLAQRRFMYFPAATLPAPRDVGLSRAEIVTFQTADGLVLGGWFLGTGGTSPQVTVLVLNGNAGNRAHRAPLAAALERLGLQVLLLDYRGYGGNPGNPTEEGLVEDGRAARAYLAARRDVDASRIVYLGESLGTAVAIRLAVEHPPAALILRSPFTSMVDLGQHHYPFLPVRLLLRDRFEVLDLIRRVRVPLLVVVGRRDRVVPVENSQRVFAAATGPKALVVLPDADHNDFDLLAGNNMMAAIDDLLQPLR